MNEQSGRRRRRHPVQWAGLNMARAGLFEIAPQPQRHHCVSVHALSVGVGKVRRPIYIYDARDLAGIAWVPVAFEFRHMGCDADKLRQVSTSRAARYADAFFVYLVLGGISPEPP